jgi:hypothetical protein
MRLIFSVSCCGEGVWYVYLRKECDHFELRVIYGLYLMGIQPQYPHCAFILSNELQYVHILKVQVKQKFLSENRNTAALKCQVNFRAGVEDNIQFCLDFLITHFLVFVLILSPTSWIL